MVVEKASEICERGDRVAHQTPPTRKIYHGALTRLDDAGMRAIAELYVCRKLLLGSNIIGKTSRIPPPTCNILYSRLNHCRLRHVASKSRPAINSLGCRR